jgi:general stress protein 26
MERSMPEQLAEQDKIWKAVEGFTSCMLVTRSGEELRSRPMGPIVRARDGVIYFITDRRGFKDEEIAADAAVCLAFSSGNVQVSLSGSAHLVEDKALVKALWSPMAQAFFPNGADDPNVTVIAVAPRHGEMWEGQNMVTTMFKVAAAIATGNRAEIGQSTRAEL